MSGRDRREKFDQETLSRARARASRVVVVDRPSMLGRGPATGPAEALGEGPPRGRARGRGTGGVIGSLRERDGAPRNRSIRPLVPYTTGTHEVPLLFHSTLFMKKFVSRL